MESALLAAAVVLVFVGLDLLASRWFLLLPESIRRRGLVGLVWARLTGRR
jgi:hypothetical protein